MDVICKKCIRCNIEKEEFCFPVIKSTGKLWSYCKICRKEKHEEYRRKHGIKKMQKNKNPFPYFKICNRCLLKKASSDFGVHKENAGGYIYLKSFCRQCEREIAKIYYDKNGSNLEFKKKNCERAKRYAEANIEDIKLRKQTIEFKKKHAELNNKSYHKNKEIISERTKIYRTTDHYKELRKSYRQKNKDKIRKQETVCKKRYHEKNRDELTDKYVLRLITTQGYCDKNTLLNNPSIIQAKKLQILIKRKLQK